MEDVLKSIVAIIERMERDLASLREQVTQLLNEQQPSPPKKQKVSKSVQSTQQMPDDEEMKELWKQLESEYIQRGRSVVSEFVEKHTKPFLRAFVRANNLPVNLKLSKDAIAEQLIQLLAVHKAISRPTFTRPPKITTTEQLVTSEEGTENHHT